MGIPSHLKWQMVKKLSQNAFFSEVMHAPPACAWSGRCRVGRGGQSGSHGGRCRARSGKCGARKSDQCVCLVGPTNACTGMFNVRLAAVNAGLAAEVKVGHAAVHAGQGEGLALKLGHGGHAGHGGHGMEGEGQCGW